MNGVVILLLMFLCLLFMLVCYAALMIASDYDDLEDEMLRHIEKTCGNCRYAEKDWTNKDNPDCYCSNEDAEDFGFNTDVLHGCEEWEARR